MLEISCNTGLQNDKTADLLYDIFTDNTISKDWHKKYLLNMLLMPFSFMHDK